MVRVSFLVIAMLAIGCGSSEDRVAVKRLEVQMAALQERVDKIENQRSSPGAAAVPAPTAYSTSTHQAQPFPIASASAAAPVQTVAPAPAAAATATTPAGDIVVVDVGARPGEQNSSWTKYGWRLTVSNVSDQPQRFSAELQFVDGEDYVVDTTPTGILTIRPGVTETFTGEALVDASVVPRVVSIKAVAKVRR